MSFVGEAMDRPEEVFARHQDGSVTQLTNQ